MRFDPQEILETVEMLTKLNLDVRAVTLSLDTSGLEEEEIIGVVEDKAPDLKASVDKVSERHGVPIVTTRIVISPVANTVERVAGRRIEEAVDKLVSLAKELDDVARKHEIHAIGGFGGYGDVYHTKGLVAVINSLPEILPFTERIFSFVNAGNTWDGLNAELLRLTSEALLRSAERNVLSGAKFVVTVNVPKDSPFLPAAHHGEGRPDEINIAVSGPGVIEAVIKRMKPKKIRELHDLIKRTSFKVARLGEFVGREVAKEMGVEMGSVDLSLAPSPKLGDSVALIVEAMGVEFGKPGTIASLALLIDAVKKGGAMAVSKYGGFSGLFIPLSEDKGMGEAARKGNLSVYKLIAMTAVCSTGLDMVPIPWVSKETVASLTLDQLTIGLVHNKPIGVRLIPAKVKPFEEVSLGGLLGSAVALPVEEIKGWGLLELKGSIPPGLLRLHNG